MINKILLPVLFMVVMGITQDTLTHQSSKSTIIPKDTITSKYQDINMKLKRMIDILEQDKLKRDSTTTIINN
jgi:hypothetical protein